MYELSHAHQGNYLTTNEHINTHKTKLNILFQQVAN